MSFHKGFAANGDSIFNIKKIHSLYITFPYPSFYDSLIKTNTTDLYLQVKIKFNDKIVDTVGIKVKGNSSFNTPSQKKSFKIDFNNFISKQDLHGLKKLNFNNNFKDPTFMREKITNDFIRKFDAPAPRVAYCNVYMNNQLWGLYTIVENIDAEFCKRWFNNKDGNLFQGDPKGSLQWKGSANQSLYTGDYDLQNNNTANNFSDLITLINTINNSPSNNFKQNLDTILHTGNFVKQWAVLNLFASFDSYIGSGHNYFIYHDTIIRKFQWIAWDNNESFGSFKFSLTNLQILATDVFYLNMPTSKPLCDKMLKDSLFKKMYIDSFCMIFNSFTNEYFNPIIDSLYPFIKPSVYNDPKKMYTNNDFETNITSDIFLPGPGGLNVFGLKNFIRDRSAAVKTSLTTNKLSCVFSSEIIKNDIETSSVRYILHNNEFFFSENTDVSLIDLLGRKIISRKAVSNLNIDQYPNATYILMIHQKDATRQVKFYKE